MSEALTKYLEAGRIAAQLREEAKKIIDVGVSLLEVCEKLERKTTELGGQPAFPVNIGVNEVTAHYTSPSKDPAIIPENSIVKIDIGAHLDGFIADTALTFNFNPVYQDLVYSSQDALQKAIECMRPGVKVSEIGSIIERTIMRYGHKPIRNLMGHRIERYSLHTGKSIPNVSSIDGGKIEEGEVYAVEPFATFREATGLVRDSTETYIFRFNKEKRLKSTDSKSLLECVKREHRFLPFASRWLHSECSLVSFDNAFKELLQSRCILPYKVLVESSGHPVAQSEHTVIVESDGCRQIT